MSNTSNTKKQTVGGQALIEGVMMRCENKKAIAVRRQDGSILVKKEELQEIPKGDPRRWPVARGVWMLMESMIQGTKDINYSAGFFAEGEEEEEPGWLDKMLTKYLGDKAEQVFMGFATVLAVVLGIGLFMALPAFLAGKSGGAGDKNVLFSLREGLVKIALFIAYLFAVSRMKEIHRVFEYHGAEHKSVFAFEQGVELVPAEVKKMSRLHPRCGTNFIFVVLLVSIALFSFLNVRVLWLRVILKLLLLPVVAGIAYECIRLAGKYQNPFTRILVFPGLMLQYITTQEPDESQLEVALAAMKAALGQDHREETEYTLGDRGDQPMEEDEMEAAEIVAEAAAEAGTIMEAATKIEIEEKTEIKTEKETGI